MAEKGGLVERIIEANSGRFGLDLRVEGDFGEAEVEAGDTGVALNVYLDGVWALTFDPPSGFRARSREDMVLNPLLFVAGMKVLLDWFGSVDHGRWMNPEGVIRNDTNPRMHNFRRQLFDELEQKTGVVEIYKETGRASDGSVGYQLRLSVLEKALCSVSQMSDEEKSRVRFWRLLERGRKLFKDGQDNERNR